jgi:hypothetical protein
MHPATAAKPARPGWRRFVLALLGFVAFAFVPLGPAFAPIAAGSVPILLGAVVVACAIVAWALGGAPSLAAVAVALGLAVVGRLVGTSEEYQLLAAGWTVVLAASFGLVSLISPTQAFLPRALTSIVTALIVALLSAATFGGGVERVRGAVHAEASRRTQVIDSVTLANFASAPWRNAETRWQWLAEFRRASEQGLQDLPNRTVLLLPAMLALQSLAALALGWTLFHRLSRTQVGPPLAPLREFRFNDQLVWAIAVGLTILVLPEFAEGRAAGLNLLLFFGALFALRGLAVFASFGRGRLLVTALVVLTLFAWPLGVGIAASLGLADIWLDVRRRTQPGH